MTTKAAPTLSVELLLHVVEELSAQGDNKTAARLAQSCKAVYCSQPGLHIRYLCALDSHSLSRPESLPSNLEYETRLLESSQWPHVDPVQQQLIAPEEPEQAAIKVVSSPQVLIGALLRGNKRIALSLDRRSILCFLGEPGAESTAVSCPSPAPATQETVVLHKRINFSYEVLTMVVDEEGIFFVTLHEKSTESGSSRQVVEVRSLESGEVVESEQELARLIIDPQPNENDKHSEEISSLELMGDYVSSKRLNGYTEVRQWISAPQKPHFTFPVVWTSAPAGEEREDFYDDLLSIDLLSPCFIAVQTLGSPYDSQDWNSTLSLYRLDCDESTPVVQLVIRDNSADGVPVDYDPKKSINFVKSGSRIAPGETGIVLIYTIGCARLLEVSAMVYKSSNRLRVCFVSVMSSSPTGGTPNNRACRPLPSAALWYISLPTSPDVSVERGLVLDTDWVQKHTLRLTRRGYHHSYYYGAVSGRRCVLALDHVNSYAQPGPGRLEFIEARSSVGETHKLSDQTRPGIASIYQRKITQYLKLSVAKDISRNFSMHLQGTRLCLQYSPEPSNDVAAHEAEMFVWRL